MGETASGKNGDGGRHGFEQRFQALEAEAELGEVGRLVGGSGSAWTRQHPSLKRAAICSSASRSVGTSPMRLGCPGSAMGGPKGMRRWQRVLGQDDRATDAP